MCSVWGSVHHGGKKNFWSMKDYQVDGNKEMVALGAINVIGSMASCYVATGSFSRSVLNYMAGYQTAVSNIVMSFVIFLTLKFFTPSLTILIWKIYKFDFVACMGAFIGVIFASVEMGLLIAVQSCGSMVTEEQPHAMLIPMEYFLMGYGLYRSCQFSDSPRCPLSPSCISLELLSPESMGLKLKPIKTRASLPI
ncbi:hypothetical protein HHK36_006675 [Tetracentron sinense]|uniref:SLC26A/SulP transporter domain-containing protein n=1 Tax=Tetracentron sinense TaxID=13715 RepID=A0A834ZQ77_TETSI|nr:hypothetical protein HHK36_006675 [Tetracentron sinense]